jgi:hypothetical protein
MLMMSFGKKGQKLASGLLILFALLLMVILSGPILYETVVYGVSNTGSASGFFVALIPWAILGVLLLKGIRVISSGSERVRKR